MRQTDREAGEAVRPPAVTTPTYEPPRLEELGTLAELTRGANPTTTDGVSPGSVL